MRGTSPILVTAALSVAGLIVATGVYFGNRSNGAPYVTAPLLEPVEPRSYLAIKDADGNGKPDWQDELLATGIPVATSTESEPEDPLVRMADSVAGALYGGYLSLKQYGSYTPAQGNELALTVAANVRAPLIAAPATVADVTMRANTPDAPLAYRADMRGALAPLVTDEPPELEYFAEYITTKDVAWLAKLESAAEKYRQARTNVLAVAVPEEAVPEHLRAINALSAYAETLERLGQFGKDTFASVALLKTLNESEAEMLAAFDALAHYYVRTIAQN